MIHSLATKITDSIKYENSGILVGYVNVYNYSIFRKHPAIIKQFTHFTLDGIALVILVRFLFGKKIKRKSPDFSSYFTELFSYMENMKRKAGFIGGSSDEMRLFRNRIESIYPGINAGLFQDGYSIDVDRLCSQLKSEEIEMLILGMGSPKQELLALKLHENGFEGSIFTCGAFISQTAVGGVEYYPRWINKLHMRWMYRIYKQPELFKRYFVMYPKALFGIITDFMRKNEHLNI